MEVTLLLRRNRRIAICAAAKIFFACSVIGLSACSYNPLDWGKKAPNGEAAKTVEAPPAEGRPYPNLATVPNPPPRPTPESRARKQQEIDALTADRDAARHADLTLRQTGEMPAAPPEPPKLEPPKLEPDAPAPAPAAAPAPLQPMTAAPEPSPAAAASAAASAPARTAISAERVGTVAFFRDTSAPTITSREALREAAARAKGSTARIRLVPAQLSRASPQPQRAQAIVQTLTAAGLPADRIAMPAEGNQRIDVYDIYIER
jgi:hypothetical protein